VRVRRHYNRRALGVERPRWHGILVLGMRIWVVPLRHLLRIGRVWRRVMLRMVLGVGIVRMVYRRVRLRRDVVLVMVLTLPSSLMHGHGRRDVRAWHHGRPLPRAAFTVSAGQRPSDKL
jgi:hypothetical protein